VQKYTKALNDFFLWRCITSKIVQQNTQVFNLRILFNQKFIIIK